MGATLEIQRSQQMEAIEQHMQRQQVKKRTFPPFPQNVYELYRFDF